MQNWLQARERTVLRYICELPLGSASPPRAVVAIPVRDEVERIGDCIGAFHRQHSAEGLALPPGTFGLVLLANNCRDATVEIARAALSRCDFPSLVINEQFCAPLANVGFARGVALELAARWLERRPYSDGVILTTDADSRVPRDWVARSMAALDDGSGAVAGRVRLQRDEMKELGPALARRGRLEAAYEHKLLRLQAHIDPVAHDPWPNHWTASGASYGLSLDAYRAIGGLPMMACGEDRALAAALERFDIAVRHDPELVVTTSARLSGRAAGGVADALRMRTQAPDMPGDDRLEPLPQALRRFLWRARLRNRHVLGSLALGDWTGPLGLPTAALQWDRHSFGAFWQKVEAASPLLARQALRPSQLPANTHAARAILHALERATLSRASRNPADIRVPAFVERHARDVAQAG